jgi:23S rRNA pseudouridine1911/1915/1917 synthase
VARKNQLEILFDDANVVAVNKPAGLATIPGRDESDSVLQMLARQLGLPSSGSTDPRLRVVHRLDKETSGILLFAKNLDAQRHLSHQFQNNTVAKEYLAIVQGHPKQESGQIDAPIAPHPTVKTRMAISMHGRRALTFWKLEQRFRDFSLLRCFPKTGKTHQIRVHLASIGVPLAVDPIYNQKAGAIFLSQIKRDYRASSREREKPLIERLTLHAERIRFCGVDGQQVEIIAAAPRDFRAACNQLART